MVCKGICVKYKAKKIWKTSSYAIGQSKCKNCDIFMMLDGVFCPCCGCRLRTHPRNRKAKEKCRNDIS